MNLRLPLSVLSVLLLVTSCASVKEPKIEGKAEDGTPQPEVSESQIANLQSEISHPPKLIVRPAPKVAPEPLPELEEPEPAVEAPSAKEPAPAEEKAEPRSADSAPSIPWRTETYSLVARGLPVREALDSFAIAQGLSLVPSAAVSGSLSGDFTDLPPAEFLDRVAAMNNLTWYYDGAALYVYGAGEIETSLIDLSYMKAGEVRTMLRDLGVEDNRFPLKTTSDDELVMVSGPPRYVALVQQTIAKADHLRELRTVSRVETRIFPIHHTWADDVSFSTSSPEGSSNVKGVATVLAELMAAETMTQVEAGSTGAVDRAQSAADARVKPVIRADNRTNSVLVRDISSRMPMYEELIARLDVPVPLIEISVTILDMNREAALDWELEVRAEAAKKRWAGAAGQAAGNLTAAEEIAGNGLAGALTYLGKDFNLAASLNALRSKGKSRAISRPSLLTVNNLAAQMSDTQSYHARVVGESVASLESVSAGIDLVVKPRIVESLEPGGRTQIWLSVQIRDGGFETVSVDSMPMTRDSSITTQTAVHEGDSIAIGGYFRDIDDEDEWGIPILRDIPLIGWLFGGYSTAKTTVQRLFILSPRIIDLDAEELVREQATTMRDISLEETLFSDKDIDDDERELRDMERDERAERREDRLRREVERRKAELKFERERRKAEAAAEKDAWREDLEARRDAWLESLEEAKKETAEEAVPASPDEAVSTPADTAP